LSTAKLNSDLVEGVSYIYVSNSNVGEIRKFQIRYESGSMGEQPLFIVSPVTVDSATQSKFVDAMYYRDGVKGFFEYHKNIPTDVALSVWQLAGSSLFQRDIARYNSSHQILRKGL